MVRIAEVEVGKERSETLNIFKDASNAVAPSRCAKLGGELTITVRISFSLAQGKHMAQFVFQASWT